KRGGTPGSELGDATWVVLDIVSSNDVTCPRSGLFDRTEHDRDVRSQSDAMRDAVGFEPFVGIDLVRAENGTDGIVEDLRCRPGKTRQTGIDESSQIVRERFVETTGAFGHLQGGETVNMQLRCGTVAGSSDADVRVTNERRAAPS